MLFPRQYAIYEDLDHLGRERQKNWPDAHGPTCEDTETRHLARIQELKDELARFGKET